MIKFICIGSLTIALVSILFFLLNIRYGKIRICKLEKIALLIYTLLLAFLWMILLNSSIYLFKPTKLKIIIFEIFAIIIIFILSSIFKKLKFKYIYGDKEYNIDIITAIEILVLKIYPILERVNSFIFRTLKNLISLIPIIIIELLFIYCFSIFKSIDDKEWEIFELILTTIIITAYVNVYNSERERRNKLKWQYKYSYFVENNMYDYIEKIMLIIGLTNEKNVKL